MHSSTLEPSEEDDKLAKPNYQYEKRQKDLAKKKKQEEKRLRKLAKTEEPPKGDPTPGAGGGEPSSDPA